MLREQQSNSTVKRAHAKAYVQVQLNKQGPYAVSVLFPSNKWSVSDHGLLSKKTFHL
jgi:hypothetical protein